MNKSKILTAESVTEGHLDKLCDLIADSVLDECLRNDPKARVAFEVMATAGKIIVAGEITAKELPDIPHIVCSTVRNIGYDCDYEVEVITHDQSPDISSAVDGCSGNDVCGTCDQTVDHMSCELGAGDQGIMYGYADCETDVYLPLPVVLAHRITSILTAARKTGLIKGIKPDGKAQVSVEYKYGVPYRLSAAVVSCQHDKDKDIDKLREEIMEHVLKSALLELPIDDNTEVLINPSGRFVLGGFEADTGLTGRKLMVDTYGGLAPHGGALSGKDCTKVDRSGAYMARYIAKNIVAAGLARRCTVSLAYAIGKAEPMAVDVDTHSTGEYDDEVIAEAVQAVFDLRPGAIIRTLGLDQPIFAQTTNYGHFTKPGLPWERPDKTDELDEACSIIEEELWYLHNEGVLS